MIRKHLLTACSLLAVTLVMQVPAAQAMVYPDLDYQHPYLRGIAGLSSAGIIHGYEDGLFRPDGHLSRIEALKIIFKSADIQIPPVSNTQYFAPQIDRHGKIIPTTTPAPNTQPTIGFPDVAKDSWYAPYVNEGEEREIIHGYEDGLFRPNAPVTRVAAYKMLLRAQGLLTDAPVEGEDWFTPYVKFVMDHNLSYFPHTENIYNQQALISRGEFSDLVYRLSTLSRSVPMPKFVETSYPQVSIPTISVDTSIFGQRTTVKKTASSDNHYQAAGSNSWRYTAQNYEEAKAIAREKFNKDITVEGIVLANQNFNTGAYPFSTTTWSSPFEDTGLTYAQWYAMKATSMLADGYLKNK